ncbi:hypothetical protein LTR56_013104 [Elasticomyces elasticus]|nr:hypothetical protein LTR56_013104 [Elasticomyces elasticus]KAK3640283.1 hypothetical protein LTR22_017118 [Elasticomyces elasticus]KAK4920560.1 hypothetical protein LTR49_011975 [Elasticomyces elasticus]KAK5758940.1 hypothetical protein LTS12_010881 [Elasticomyces elasticus]
MPLPSELSIDGVPCKSLPINSPYKSGALLHCGNCNATTFTTGTPLQICGRCKGTAYCSRECQATDWPKHKAPCKQAKEFTEFNAKINSTGLKTTTIISGTLLEGVGILITPVVNSTASHGTAYIHQVLPTIAKKTLDAPGWHDLTLTRQLGFPLRLIGLPPAKGEKELRNVQLEQTGLQTDPEQPGFGYSIFYGPQSQGTVIIVRADGEKLHAKHLEVVLRYICEDLKEIQGVQKRWQKLEGLDSEGMVERLLTPKAFVAGFERIKGEEMEKGGEQARRGWEGVECPVKLG